MHSIFLIEAAQNAILIIKSILFVLDIHPILPSFLSSPIAATSPSADPPADFHFYEDLFTNLDSSLTTYVSDVAGNIISAITPVATSMLTIYIILWGWMIMRGMITEPITDGATRLVRLALITGLALNLGRYNGYIADWLWSSPDAIASYIASGYSDETTNIHFLDQIMNKVFDFGTLFFHKGMATGIVVPDFGFIFVAILIWVGGMAATGYAALLLALAKIFLAALLAVGPIFVLLSMFEVTRKFLESWLGQVLNFIFVVMLTAAILKLLLTIVQLYLTASGSISDPSISQAIPCIVLCVIGALALIQVPGHASALGGGVAINTLGIAHWALRRTKATMSALRPTTLKRSWNNLKSDFRIAKNAAKSVGSAPMAVYRKITGSKHNRISRG